MRNRFVIVCITMLCFISLSLVATDFQSPFAALTSNFVLTDTSSKLSFSNNSELYGWKGGSVLHATDDTRQVDFKDQSIDGYIPYYRVRKEFLISAKDYLSSFNLGGDVAFDRAWGGDVEQITVGSCANVWAIDGSKIYSIDIDGETQVAGIAYPWIEEGDAVDQFSAGKDNSLWAIGGAYGGLNQGDIYEWKDDLWNSVEMPSGVADATSIAVGDNDNIWMIGLDASETTTYVYRWSRENGWEDRKIGALYPTDMISVGGDGLVLGIRKLNQLVLWDPSSKAWYDVNISLAGHTISYLSVGAEENTGLIITLSGSSISQFYKMEHLSDSSPYSATVNLVQENVSKVEMGFFGDAWYLDAYENYWHRLAGAVIRSVVNYVSRMPNISFHEEELELEEGTNTMVGNNVTKGVKGKGNSNFTLDDFMTFMSPLDLNGATMEFFTDIRFSSKTYLVTGGKINAHGHAIFLGGDFYIPDGESLRFTSSCIIDGKGHNLILRNDSQLIIDSNVTLTLRNLTLKGLRDTTNSKFLMIDSDSTVAFQNVEIALSGDYTFTQGHLYVTDDLVISGTSKFNYISSQTSYIREHSSLIIDLSSTFSYEPASGSRDLIDMRDVTSFICFNGSTLAAPAVSNGLLFTKGTVVFDNDVNIENLDSATPNSNVSKAVTLGDGSNASNNVNTIVGAGATINIEGYLDYNPA